MSVEILGQREVARMRARRSSRGRDPGFGRGTPESGRTMANIDTWVREHTKSLGGTPSQLGYMGFPATVCTSRNQVVCHGVPRRDDVLQVGDIVNVDVTTNLDGYHGDTSATFTIAGFQTRAVPIRTFNAAEVNLPVGPRRVDDDVARLHPMNEPEHLPRVASAERRSRVRAGREPWRSTPSAIDGTKDDLTPAPRHRVTMNRVDAWY